MRRQLTTNTCIVFLSFFLFLFLIPLFKITFANPEINAPSSAFNGAEISLSVSGINEAKTIRLEGQEHQKTCTGVPPNFPILLKMPGSGNKASLMLVEQIIGQSQCANAKNIINDQGFIVYKEITLSPQLSTTGTCSVDSDKKLTANNCVNGNIPYVDYSLQNPNCECKSPTSVYCDTTTSISGIPSCLSSSLSFPIRCGSNLSGFNCRGQRACVIGSGSSQAVACELISTSPTPTPIPSAPIITPCPEGDCINTALGLIPIKPAGLVSRLFSLLLGLSGGIALILIMISGYSLMTSGANAEAVQGAKETLTSAIVGLLFIIFSLVILEVIGVDILKIPGLGR